MRDNLGCILPRDFSVKLVVLTCTLVSEIALPSGVSVELCVDVPVVIVEVTVLATRAQLVEGSEEVDRGDDVGFARGFDSGGAGTPGLRDKVGSDPRLVVDAGLLHYQARGCNHAVFVEFDGLVRPAAVGCYCEGVGG
ncbi:hypothetical protein AA313_de0204752 [Arthrobotrys entomopaga]|nr:hypothetical protein AA313_de0204752 [Arthrobotrys entomopaga]